MRMTIVLYETLSLLYTLANSHYANARSGRDDEGLVNRRNSRMVGWLNCCENSDIIPPHQSSPSPSSTPRMYMTLLHLIRISPRFPAQAPSMYSSALSSCMFM